MKKEIIDTYLDKYQYGKYKIEKNFTSLKNAVVVIPCYNEYENLPNLLSSISLNNIECLNRTAFLFVINNNISSPISVKEDNQRSLNLLRAFMQSQNALMTLNICLIDASSPGNELDDRHGGVGLARKIGMDAALRLLDPENLNDSLIISLDADCIVSRNYLSDIFSSMDKLTHFAIIKYEHRVSQNDLVNRSITAYEIFLRYYYLGLLFAESHYALHTIGSAFVCRPEIYIKCEGMNKRKAGEDFYFIEKMAKHGIHKYIKSCTVFPSPRPSDRVPFGTGRAVLTHLKYPENMDKVYDPNIFRVLKNFLEEYKKLVRNPGEFLISCQKIEPRIFDFLLQNKFVPHWKKILSANISENQLDKQKNIWFDGFRTLKLVHYLRDNGYPNRNSFDAVPELINLAHHKFNFKPPGKEISSDPFRLLQYLRGIT